MSNMNGKEAIIEFAKLNDKSSKTVFVNESQLKEIKMTILMASVLKDKILKEHGEIFDKKFISIIAEIVDQIKI